MKHDSGESKNISQKTAKDVRIVLRQKEHLPTNTTNKIVLTVIKSEGGHSTKYNNVVS